MGKYEIHNWKNPDIPFRIKKKILDENQKNSGANWHENLELLFFTEGEGTVLNENTKINVKPGDIMIINSNNLHDIFTDHYLCYYFLIIDRSFCISKKVDTNKVQFKLRAFREEKLNWFFKQLIEEYEGSEISELKNEAIRSYVSLILMFICRFCTNNFKPTTETGKPSYIEQAIGYIHSNSSSPNLSLDEISEFVGVSKYYFIHLFNKSQGMTCVQFINKTRCEKAKILLAEKRLTIEEISCCCGFNSQSYFTRIFHECVGVSPGSYQKRKFSNSKSSHEKFKKPTENSQNISFFCE